MKVMETEGAYQEQLPQEVTLYLDWFDQAEPLDVVQAHQELYVGKQAEDPLRSMLYDHLQHALSLYPSYSLYTNPGKATELYASFARSENTSDVKGMLSVFVNLWNSDPRGATRVAKLCLTRQTQDGGNEVVLGVTREIIRHALLNNVWLEDEADELLYLEVERVRREPPPSPAS